MVPSAVMDRIECQWCKAQNDAGQTTCATCGAPLDARNLVSDSGWKEAPRLRDMTEFKFSNSSCQVEGELVPVAEINLAQGDWVFFEHHVLLWKDEGTPLSAMAMSGGLKRMLGGMPHVISVAHGPGRVAFSRTHPVRWWSCPCTRAWRSTCESTPSWWRRTRSPTRSSASRA